MGRYVPDKHWVLPKFRGPCDPGPNDRQHRDVPVFDKGRLLPTETSGASVYPPNFHRTDSDRRPPKKVVTREVMGDPMPGRTPWAAK